MFTQSMLRDSTSVDWSAENVKLSYAQWTLELPVAWVESKPGIKHFFQRDLPAEALSGYGHEALELSNFLKYSGCLTYSDNKDAYSWRESLYIFRCLAAQWYGLYYRHPLWVHIASGKASANVLRAWVVYNYHLSRSVGMTAARSAALHTDPKVRRLFAASTLEEYGHCRYYFSRNIENIGLERGELGHIMPLPSSTAFDQAMLRIAEQDWMAHVFVGLFQEQTSSFLSSAEEYLDGVSKTYGLEDFFQPWLDHGRLDVDYGHADEFSDFLESDEQVSREQLKSSIQSAWHIFGFLLDGLDDILDQEGKGAFASSRNDHEPLISEVTSGAGPNTEFVRDEVVAGFLRAMSCVEREEVMVPLGDLAELALRDFDIGNNLALKATAPPSRHAWAVANFLREASLKPGPFASLLLHRMANHDGESTAWLPLPNEEKVRRLLAGLATADPVMTFRLDELWNRWINADQATLVPDFFKC